MPYKDPEKNRECKRRWYRRNRKSEIQRHQRRRRELTEWVREIKKEFKCSKCGEANPACIDFHHKNRYEKEMMISEMPNRGFSRERIRKEIEKCIPLCANCHRKLHYKETIK